LFEGFEKEIGRKDAEAFLKMFSVFCPHIAEELWGWGRGKGFVSLAKWPVADLKKIDKKLEEQDKAIEKLKQDIGNIIKIIADRGEKKEKVYVYVLPKELEMYKELDGIDGIKIFAVNDKNKYDPKGMSKKSKPGRPAIFLE